ncbi:probable plastid-lipid-associated protein 12, chloroplastic isoform X2 [Cucurbita maxima]|uniref:Probable plastid-lipid-associated protein 12, chloroplastic isoform X2 n=1 Tax=Cucurbita maxima TaxID=3661 RepID=A0A6J1JD06_CUCMA|nr:probable plastid-lipid-associated protein 12, chloroplastic isoform X2 [Cucurbita maxima]
MALKANAIAPTYLHRSFFTPQAPSLPPIKRYHRYNTHIRLRCRSSLVDEQQKEVVSFSEPENSLIEALIGVQGRGRAVSSQQLSNVERAVSVLEGLEGVRDPTNSSLIEGRWQLVFTTRPGTASIIQAAASVKDGKRILFQFDKAAFSFKFLPFKVPYPVPFRLLGDEAKGWLDTTYLSPSGNLRISRGNKGTTFVLQKQTEARQNLLLAISAGKRVEEAIDKLVSEYRNENKFQQELLEGDWNMLWSSQMETDSWIENAANGLMGMQIIKNGQMKFRVDMLLGMRFSMTGTFVKSADDTYDVSMDDAAIIGGPFGYPVEMESRFKLQLLYNDGKIRITRGYNNILFVHLRVGEPQQV